MAVNEEYFGSKSTWHTAHTKSENQNFEVKIANFNANNTTECLSGAFVYKFGEIYDQTEDYKVEIDKSFCYCAMDKNAPCLTALFASSPITSGDNAGHFYSKLKISPENNVPFGWSMGTVQQYVTTIGSGGSWSNAPINYKPVWYDSEWTPAKVTSYSKTAICYLANSAPVDYTLAPILSFPYKNVKLVPVIRAYSLASGKTENDIKNAVSLSDFNSCVSTSIIVDLKTYLTDSYDNTPFYQKFPVIASIYAMPILLLFDTNGDLITPAGSLKKYHSTAESTSSWSSLRSAFNPAFFHEKTVFQEIYKYDGTAYENEEDKECEAMLFPCSRAPFSYVNYNYNGGTNPSGSVSVDSNGWGCFCVAGRATASGNIRTDMYCRVIDSDNFRTFWDSTNSNCECGNLVSDYTDLNGFRKYVRKIIAYFGMFFSDGVENDIEEKATMDTAGLHLGIIDNNGITHGEYTTGTENTTALNYEWSDPVEDTPFTPGGGGDDSEIPSDLLTLNTNAVTGFGVACNYYALRQTDIEPLTNWIKWYLSYDNAVEAANLAGNPYEQIFNDRFKNQADWYTYVFTQAGFGIHPNNDIISLMAFPFELSGTDSGYMLGGWDTSEYHNYFQLLQNTPLLQGKHLTGDGFKIVKLGKTVINFDGLHGDFRDYPPYTRLELQIPYHGTVQLDTGEWINKEIEIIAIVDLMTGASLCVICRNGTPVITIPGTMGISVPISIDNVSQTANTFNAMSIASQGLFINTVTGILTGITRTAGNIAGAVASGVTGNIPGVLGGAMGSLGSEYSMIGDFLNKRLEIKQNTFDMEHTVNGKLVSGGGTPNTGVKYETQCRLVWHYPVEIPGSNPEQFAEICGHACNITGKVEDFTGFAQFGSLNIDGIPGTQEEQTAIITMLQNGIFV